MHHYELWGARRGPAPLAAWVFFMGPQHSSISIVDMPTVIGAGTAALAQNHQLDRAARDPERFRDRGGRDEPASSGGPFVEIGVEA